jgi:hypothetical protein
LLDIKIKVVGIFIKQYRMKLLKLLAIIAGCAVPVAVSGQQAAPGDTLLNHLTGRWVLKGTIAGKNIQHDIAAELVLGHQYIELKETSQEKLADGKPFYDAIVFFCYNKTRNQYDCLWLDNTGTTDFDPKVVAHATPKTNTIELLFNMSDKSLFHTTLTFIPDENKWRWLMESDENGKIEVFADAEMLKQ